jgi:putative membrane protein
MYPGLTHWSLSIVALAAYAVAASAHLVLARRLRRRRRQRHRHRATIRDAALVQGGLAIALLALISPAGYLSGIFIWIRALQDLTLCFVAPALIVAGRPWLVLPRPARPGMPRPARPGMPRPAGPWPAGREDRPEQETAWSRTGPVLAAVVFNLVWIGWHVPAAFDLFPRSAAARLAEYACYLGAGTWFWLQLAGPPRRGRWDAPLRRLALLTATVATGTVLGMVLVFGASVIYPGYANSAHHVLTVLDDQQLAGAILWMGMLPPLIVAGVWLLLTWLNDEERDEPADLGRLLGYRTSGWPR